MKAFSKKLTEHQIWDVVNYVRTLGPKPAKSH
jgi:mono/diheme cytochrome c family protein